MENSQNKSFLESNKREVMIQWENLYLRLKRLLAKQYAKTPTEETTNQLKEIKESYEGGLQAIEEKWI